MTDGQTTTTTTATGKEMGLFVEMKLVVSSLRGWAERVLVRQTVASGSDKEGGREDSSAIPPRQLKSRSVGETSVSSCIYGGCVGEVRK